MADAPKKRIRWHIRLLLCALAYVVGLNMAVRRYGGDSFPLSVTRIPEKSLALSALALHSIKHVWSSACDDTSPFVTQAALEAGVPVQFALAVARQESGFRSHSISSTGAMGVMQLMPRTARSYGVIDPFDPEDNARGGTRYLSDLFKTYRGNRMRVAAAYNAGSGRVPRRGQIRVPASTLSYAASVVRSDRRAAAALLRQPLP
jgi:soluble lytic murein transglycosylase-like protein